MLFSLAKLFALFWHKATTNSIGPVLFKFAQQHLDYLEF